MTPACPILARKAAIAETTAQEVQTTRQRMRARADRADRWTNNKSGGVHGRERAGIAGRDAGWQRNPTGPDAWAHRHHRWSLVSRGGNVAECHERGDECARGDSVCANLAACDMGACGQCMPGGAPEGGWRRDRCEAESGGEEDEIGAPLAQRRRRA